MAAQKQRQQRGDGHAGQQLVVASEQAPGRAGITPVHELEKAFYDHFLLRVAEEAEHKLLG